MYSLNRSFSVTNTTWAMSLQQKLTGSPGSLNWPFTLGIYINYLPNKREWSVQFSNAHVQLKLHQIYQFFSVCGRITNVIQCTNYNRIVYVNFSSEMDAKRCVIAMMQQRIIQLIPFVRNQRNNQSSGTSSFKNLTSTNKKRNISDGMNTNGNINGSSKEESPVKDATEEAVDPEDPPKRSTTQVSEGEMQLSGIEVSTGKSKTVNVPERMEEKFSTTKEYKPQVIVDAQEVIVANVPEGYGVFYVLHLLEKLEPIFVTEMKTLEEQSLRYCLVYFKTPRDAEAAQVAFDNVELAGKHLIIMTPHSMAEEAEK
uniref:RSP31 protein n=1 Tax=Fopius arisanus TaxID=64838 RepID=A0A0C9RLM0_9HYME